MTVFTVPSEACQAQFQWTGVQTSFPCGFPALDEGDLLVTYTEGNPAVTTTLAIGINYTVQLDPLSGAVTVVPATMPDNGPATVTITRNTPAVQETQFNNLDAYQADPLTALFDAAMMCLAECKRRLTELETVAFGAPQVPPSFSFGIRTQRSITNAGGLTITPNDSILNINASTDLALVVPAGSIRGGAPLTFKNLPGSHLQTITPTGTDTFDGAANFPLQPGASVTLVPFNDGVNQGYAIE